MKRKLLISGTIATLVTLFGAVGLSTGELDLPGINAHLSNLDARTTNNEQDIKQLQTVTSTTPGPHVDVPAPDAPTPAATTSQPVQNAAVAAPTTPTATPAPTPVPVTVIGITKGAVTLQQSNIGPYYQFTCTYDMSDGTSQTRPVISSTPDALCPVGL